MPNSYEWYEIATGSDVQQGDIVTELDVPVIIEIVNEDPPIKAKIEQYDVIIMTQSCDIPKSSISHLVLCPIWKISDLAKDNAIFNDNAFLEDIRQGRNYKFHLLNKCNIKDFACDYRVVQFEKPMTTKKADVITVLESRGTHLRLLPPYREEMAQRFGLNFSRIGKPKDIPIFK